MSIADELRAEIINCDDKRLRRLLVGAFEALQHETQRAIAAERRANDIKAEADRRVADIKAEAKVQVSKAERRADEAHDRLVDFGQYALKCATKVIADSIKPVEKAKTAISDSFRINDGCQARLMMNEESAWIDFPTGSPRDIVREMRESPEIFGARRVKVIKRASSYISVGNPDTLIKDCMDYTKRKHTENDHRIEVREYKRRRRLIID